MAKLTSQEQAYLKHLSLGMNPAAAARAAGMKAIPVSPAVEAAAKEQIYTKPSLKITRDMLNHMLMEAHGHAASASEEIAAIRELGKLNGLYEQTDGGINVQINNIKQLEELDDSKLIELAAIDIDTLDPHATTEPAKIEAKGTEG